MRRRVASCCCAGNPCDQLNLQCFGNVIPPKYVRIDGIQSLYALNNTLCAQPTTGIRCRCCTKPDQTITHSLLFHAEGPRFYFNNGFSQGWRYQLTGTWSLDETAIQKCIDPTYPPPFPLCPIEEIQFRQRTTQRGTFVGQLYCGPITCYTEDGAPVNYVGYSLDGTLSLSVVTDTFVHVCGDPAGNDTKQTERTTITSPLQLAFTWINLCSFKGICPAPQQERIQFRNVTFKQPECSDGFYTGFYPLEYRYTGSIAAVFARA
jgi:hypothetical protein